MSTFKRWVFVPALALAAALAWTSVGSFDTASGQTPSPGPILVSRAHDGSNRPDFTEPIQILVLGSDARVGNPERALMDSIHIVGIDPVERRASILGIPRDSYVPIPGFGTRKINSAGPLGGPALMMQTIESNWACDFDYYMLTGFQGFAGDWRNDPKNETGLINQIGGVRFDVPVTLPDKLPRVVPPRGTHTLNGAQALSWSRNRKKFARGDFDRSLNQGKLMLAVLAEMRRDFAEDPGTALRNIAALRRNIAMDIPVTDSLALGLMALRLKPKRVENVVMDGGVGTAGGASIVRVTERGRQQLVDICADGLLDQT